MNKSIYRVLAICLWSLCFSVTAGQQTQHKGDIKDLMHGVWAEFYNDDGKILSYMTYLPEGRFHGYGYLDEDLASYWFADGLWLMSGDQSCIVFTYDSFGIMKEGEPSCVTILSVKEKVLIYRDNEDNSVHTMKRVSTGFIKE